MINKFISDFEPATNPALASMILIRDFDSQITQSFFVQTDIEKVYGPVCNYVATLTPTWNYVSISGSTASYTITVDENLTVGTDVGIHSIAITVNSLEYSSTVTPKTYTFSLDIQHCVANIFLPAIGSQTYKVNTGIKELTLSPATLDKACTYARTYSVTSPLSLPSWITWDASLQKFTFNPTIPAHVGSISITVEVSIPDPATSPTATKTS